MNSDLFFYSFSELNDKLTLPDGTNIYFDMKDGVFGYNTDSARGADTFHPFSGGSGKLTINFSYTATTNGSAGKSETGNGTIIVEIEGGNVKSQSITGSKSMGFVSGSTPTNMVTIGNFSITSVVWDAN